MTNLDFYMSQFIFQAIFTFEVGSSFRNWQKKPDKNCPIKVN